MSINRWNKENQELENLVPSTEPKEYYSTEETLTNKVWIDGKPIYRKCFIGLSIVSIASEWIRHIVEIPNLDNTINISLYGKYASGEEKVKIGIIDIETFGNYIDVSTMKSGRYINTVIAEYTKTTD